MGSRFLRKMGGMPRLVPAPRGQAILLYQIGADRIGVCPIRADQIESGRHKQDVGLPRGSSSTSWWSCCCCCCWSSCYSRPCCCCARVRVRCGASGGLGGASVPGLAGLLVVAGAAASDGGGAGAGWDVVRQEEEVVAEGSSVGQHRRGGGAAGGMHQREHGGSDDSSLASDRSNAACCEVTGAGSARGGPRLSSSSWSSVDADCVAEGLAAAARSAGGGSSPCSVAGDDPWLAADRQRQEEFILARLHSLLPSEVPSSSDGSQAGEEGGGGPPGALGAGAPSGNGACGFAQHDECDHSTSSSGSRFDGALRSRGRSTTTLRAAAMTLVLGLLAAYIFALLFTSPPPPHAAWDAGAGAQALPALPPRRPRFQLDAAALLLDSVTGPLQCLSYARSCPLLGFLALLVCVVVGAWVSDGRRWSRKAPPPPPAAAPPASATTATTTTCVHCEGQRRSRSMIDEADERALKAQKAKQQFMAYVFHNIRVPFNAIVLGLGHMRAIRSGDGLVAEDSDRIDLLQMMLDCAETMTGVLDDVTDMGQWEDGRMELTNDEFDLLAVIKFLSWGLRDLLDQKQIQFNMHIDALAKKCLAQHRVVADKHRVVQTLGNFLSNAMKFTPSGGKVQLSVKCLEVMEDQDWAVSTATPALLDQSSPASPSVGRKNLQLSVPEISSFTTVLESPRSEDQLLPETTATKYKVARIQISVRDTGIGISVADQAKLFEPYSFVTSGWVQKAGVSGLGLSMAKRFVEQVGGQIGVNSTEGEGSTFYFSIPFPLMPVTPQSGEGDDGVAAAGISCDSCETACIPNLVAPKHFAGFEDEARFKENLKAFKGRTSKSASSSQLLGGSGSLNRKRRVLLVEDTAINRIVLRKVLENLNLLVEEAENGKIAVDMAQQGRKYDLILMDKEMPVMDGHQATRQLRTMGVKTPIIALTGNSLQSDRELFFEAGVDDFQTKPLSRDKLVQLLARYGVENSCA